MKRKTDEEILFSAIAVQNETSAYTPLVRENTRLSFTIITESRIDTIDNAVVVSGPVPRFLGEIVAVSGKRRGGNT